MALPKKLAHGWARLAYDYFYSIASKTVKCVYIGKLFYKYSITSVNNSLVSSLQFKSIFCFHPTCFLKSFKTWIGFGIWGLRIGLEKLTSSKNGIRDSMLLRKQKHAVTIAWLPNILQVAEPCLRH